MRAHWDPAGKVPARVVVRGICAHAFWLCAGARATRASEGWACCQFTNCGYYAVTLFRLLCACKCRAHAKDHGDGLLQVHHRGVGEEMGSGRKKWTHRDPTAVAGKDVRGRAVKVQLVALEARLADVPRRGGRAEAVRVAAAVVRGDRPGHLGRPAARPLGGTAVGGQQFPVQPLRALRALNLRR